MPWYRGPVLIDHLETVDVAVVRDDAPFAMPVQWVSRPHLDFRGFAGTIVGGAVAPGDEVVVAKSGRPAKVARIVTADGDPVARRRRRCRHHRPRPGDRHRARRRAGRPARRPEIADQFAAHLFWMSDEAMLPGRRYVLKLGTEQVAATITSIRHKIDVNTQEERPGRTLGSQRDRLLQPASGARRSRSAPMRTIAIWAPSS